MYNIVLLYTIFCVFCADRKLLPLGPAPRVEEALPEVVLPSQTGRLDVGNEAATVATHTQYKGIKLGYINSAAFKPQLLYIFRQDQAQQ